MLRNSLKTKGKKVLLRKRIGEYGMRLYGDTIQLQNWQKQNRTSARIALDRWKKRGGTASR